MANQWLRLWHDMPTDPKWRTISKASGQRIGDVMAVYVHMLVTASNATERGRTQSFNCEDVASALDIETEQVAAIVDAMQGRVLDGDMVRGWEKRQVAREDGAAERAKAWREARKEAKQTELNEAERNRTHGERKQTPDTDKSREEKKEKDQKTLARASRLPDAWTPTPEGLAYAETRGLNAAAELESFRDHWTAESSAKARKLDWDAAWRTWCRNAVKFSQPVRVSPVNRQKAIEDHNKAVGDQWLMEQEALDAAK